MPRKARGRTAFGRTLTLFEWAAESGIQCQTLYNRLGSGLSLEEALSRPDREGHCYQPTVAPTIRCTGVGAEASRPFIVHDNESPIFPGSEPVRLITTTQTTKEESMIPSSQSVVDATPQAEADDPRLINQQTLEQLKRLCLAVHEARHVFREIRPPSCDEKRLSTALKHLHHAAIDEIEFAMEGHRENIAVLIADELQCHYCTIYWMLREVVEQGLPDDAMQDFLESDIGADELEEAIKECGPILAETRIRFSTLIVDQPTYVDLFQTLRRQEFKKC